MSADARTSILKPMSVAGNPDAPVDTRPSKFRRPHVTVRGLTKRFDDRTIYEKFDLDLPRGQFVSIFGPNGCGKSTLMNMIAGLIPVDEGQILFDGQTIDEIRFGYVFQNYRDALFPWISAWDNIAYPLRFMKVPKAERNRRVDALVKKFDVRINLKQYPYQMSGGQQQLVSILRALVVDPEILFLDEPFSALDYEMTLFMRDQMQRMFQETGTTTIIVSHDLDEAVYLADRILLLSRAPAKVVDFPIVDVPRPRNALTLADPEFNRVKGHCLEIFQQQVRK
ncbi:ABC transporter ATP-binding protein [Tardiphaga sp. 215_C5_N2_1]|jgi:NitT/TauT family transport system ATP-binding protein|uniref:ABC transporter ATP-binding protein n=1 Tax=Tardiphaga TaxID=1395974 RepID=UPI0017F75B21|nr:MULTISPECIES: ABC transporter ATP-binding protein [Tardiphaga]MDR6661597.1 NitT/TauT family transport system ATP-binding protein [Tardiphaga robiniae]NUU43352.1 ABC transporter ATP-binding protein [Tardiphaga robiniae]UFS73770.1 ABC transporter ATP-binding protein [Tardiphaga sp. 37S4]